MKKLIAIILSILVIGFGLKVANDGSYTSLSMLDQYLVSLYKPFDKDIEVSLRFENEEALIDAGKYLGHLPAGVSMTSCFGSCHNVETGGHPMTALPSGGGEIREIRNDLNAKYEVTSVKLPEDAPIKDSPAFINGYQDSLVLWEGLASDHPFELQWNKGRHAHHMDAIEIQAKHDPTAIVLLTKAFGNDTINTDRIGCAISAFEQTIRSDSSNVARGIVTRPKGFKLFHEYCYDCHVKNKGTMFPALDTAIHSDVKGIDLSAWVFSPCDFNTCIETPVYKHRLWSVMKKHQESQSSEYDELDELSFAEIMAIDSYLKRDHTDHELGRYME